MVVERSFFDDCIAYERSLADDNPTMIPVLQSLGDGV